jgi:hypothetical protein
MDICRLTAEWLEQGSRYSSLISEVCALVCSTSADFLARYSGSEVKFCADSCRNCAEACRRLVGGAVPEVDLSIGVA